MPVKKAPSSPPKKGSPKGGESKSSSATSTPQTKTPQQKWLDFMWWWKLIMICNDGFVTRNSANRDAAMINFVASIDKVDAPPFQEVIKNYPDAFMYLTAPEGDEASKKEFEKGKEKLRLAFFRVATRWGIPKREINWSVYEGGGDIHPEIPKKMYEAQMELKMEFIAKLSKELDNLKELEMGLTGSDTDEGQAEDIELVKEAIKKTERDLDEAEGKPKEEKAKGKGKERVTKTG